MLHPFVRDRPVIERTMAVNRAGSHEFGTWTLCHHRSTDHGTGRRVSSDDRTVTDRTVLVGRSDEQATVAGSVPRSETMPPIQHEIPLPTRRRQDREIDTELPFGTWTTLPAWVTIKQ